MMIEQSFRDTKNERLGLGLTRARSQGQCRLEALLLIGHVASIAKRLIGEAAKAANLQRKLLSRESSRNCPRAQLSVMTLASRVIAAPALMRQLSNPLAHLQHLRQQANTPTLSMIAVS